MTTSEPKYYFCCKNCYQVQINEYGMQQKLRTLRSKTQIVDVAQKAANLKWDWAGHVNRMPNELWTKIITLTDRTRRHRGRPRRRWRDKLDETNGLVVHVSHGSEDLEVLLRGLFPAVR